MLTAEDSIVVDAPVDAVFAFMDDPHNQPTITPSITDVRNVEPLANGGKRLDYTYQMAGVDLHGTMETPTYEPDERIVFEMVDGDIDGAITWTFEPAEGGTRVTYRAEYELPSSVLETILRPFARRYNEREIRTTLANLKTRLESERAEAT
jgi:uncharacterized membrane protein